MKVVVSEPRVVSSVTHIEDVVKSVIDRMLFHSIGDELYGEEILQELRDKGEYLMNENGVMIISGIADSAFESSGACVSPVPEHQRVLGGNYVGLKAVCVIVGAKEKELEALHSKLELALGRQL